MRKLTNKNKIKGQNTAGWLFCSVWVVGFLVLTLYPIITSLVYSFYNVTVKLDGIEMTYKGFANYIYMLTEDAVFLEILADYIVEIVMYVPVITVVSLIIAMLLNNKLKGTGIFRTIFFLPVIITSGPVIQLFIEQGVAQFGGSELLDFTALAQVIPQFLVDALDVLTGEFVIMLWFSGIQILVFMTGLQKLDKGMYEAASIDGAGKWECFWKITLPALNTTMVVNVVFTIVIQSMFSLNPVIVYMSEVLNGTGEGSGYGYVSALAWVYFIVLICLLVFFFLIFAKRNGRKKS